MPRAPPPGQRETDARRGGGRRRGRGRVGGQPRMRRRERRARDRGPAGCGAIAGSRVFIRCLPRKARASRASRSLVGVGKIDDDVEMIAVANQHRRVRARGAGSAGHASHRIRVCRMNSEVSSAPAASTSGARDRGERCDGESRAASRSSSLKSALNEYCTIGARSCTPDSDTPPAIGSRANSVRRPVRREQHRDDVAARRMSADDDAFRIRAVRGAFAREPRDRAPALVDDRRDRHVGTEVVVDDGDRVSVRHERQAPRTKNRSCRTPASSRRARTRTSPARGPAGRKRSSVSFGPGP